MSAMAFLVPWPVLIWAYLAGFATALVLTGLLVLVARQGNFERKESQP